MYSLVIQEYRQNTEGRICQNSTLSKYGRIQRISEKNQNTEEYRTKYSRIQWLGNCSELDRKLHPSRLKERESKSTGHFAEQAISQTGLTAMHVYVLEHSRNESIICSRVHQSWTHAPRIPIDVCRNQIPRDLGPGWYTNVPANMPLHSHAET